MQHWCPTAQLDGQMRPPASKGTLASGADDAGGEGLASPPSSPSTVVVFPPHAPKGTNTTTMAKAAHRALTFMGSMLGARA
jgi:hypothetical protein